MTNFILTDKSEIGSSIRLNRKIVGSVQRPNIDGVFQKYWVATLRFENRLVSVRSDDRVDAFREIVQIINCLNISGTTSVATANREIERRNVITRANNEKTRHEFQEILDICKI